jgi:RNA polymerase sigma-70 factor, ECF subfamily
LNYKKFPRVNSLQNFIGQAHLMGEPALARDRAALLHRGKAEKYFATVSDREDLQRPWGKHQDEGDPMTDASQSNTLACSIASYIIIGGARDTSVVSKPTLGSGTASLPLRAGSTANANAVCTSGAMRNARDPKISTDSESDESLVARVADGNRRAIEQLFARHQQRVYRFALRLLGNSATAEDVVSDVFIDLWRHAAKFEGRARVSTWLLAIARNKAFSAMRGRVDQPLDDALAEAIPDLAITAEETLAASRRGTILRNCLERLSPAHREVIDLVYYHEKSIEEVSTIIGVPAATVKTRMFYARRRLAELLTAAGIATALS